MSAGALHPVTAGGLSAHLIVQVLAVIVQGIATSALLKRVAEGGRDEMTEVLIACWFAARRFAQAPGLQDLSLSPAASAMP